EFEVATIKPSEPGPGGGILVNRSGLLTTRNTTLAGLIKFAYGLHEKQVIGGQSWMESDRYDITAKPDKEGIPNHEQVTTMMQKLLADRFQLKFHREQKELSVYAITVTRTGAKLTKSDSNSPLPGIGGPPQNFSARNATIGEVASLALTNM